MPADATESEAIHTALGWNRQAFAFLHAPVTVLMFGCSGTQIYNPEVRDEGSGQLETTIEPHDRAYYLVHKLALHERKIKVLYRDLSLCNCCLQMSLISHQNIWCDMSHFCVIFSDWKLGKKTRKYYSMKFRNIMLYLKSMLHSMVAYIFIFLYLYIFEFCIRIVIHISLQKGECQNMRWLKCLRKRRLLVPT